MGVSVFSRWEIFGESYASFMFQPSGDCFYGEDGHTRFVVFYGHGMIGAVSRRHSALELKIKPHHLEALICAV